MLRYPGVTTEFLTGAVPKLQDIHSSILSRIDVEGTCLSNADSYSVNLSLQDNMMLI
jgi:hypothetical protein